MLLTKNQISKVEQLSDQMNITGRSIWDDARRRFFANKAAVVSLIVISIIALLSIAGPILSNQTLDDIDWEILANIYELSGPSFENGHYMGTDETGRDLFVRTMYGSRISLMAGIVGAAVAVLIGTIYGALSAFIGGRTDSVMMRIVDILASVPTMFFLIILLTMVGRSVLMIFVGIGLLAWLDMARIVRGQVLSIKNREFIEAAHTYGVSTWNIVIKHIIPNVLGIVMVYASLLVPSMILTESFISFLGLGVQEPETSWGALIKEGAKNFEFALHTLIFPLSLLVITMFCFNFLGDGLRDALDPKDR